ncbi:META domain-containing protein [Corynebacterium sp. S7]
MKPKTVLLLAALLPAVLIAACSSPSQASSPQGNWGSNEPQQPQLTLADDGSLSGTDGCNRIIGSWELHDERVQLSPLATTMMFCEGVDTWLSNAATAEVKRETLHLYDEAGAEIGTLERQQ